ncbi:hypothetical protein [Psychroflexus tropicus]|uniref:hypothetical protein n=1 Tax=Psychroflexus tropicus TaxID=197345 RepID=UPI000367F550|nr:hypothetical protein [Psychroflexus tropicus]
MLFKKEIYLNHDDLEDFYIPDEIKEMMKNWYVITKSPYSDSFYSSDQIDWCFKPEGSYRVSDHWNFTRKTGRIHCVTNKEVIDNEEVCIARYEDGIYRVIACYKKPIETKRQR